jgi:hypothetical protein
MSQHISSTLKPPGAYLHEEGTFISIGLSEGTGDPGSTVAEKLAAPIINAPRVGWDLLLNSTSSHTFQDWETHRPRGMHFLM